MNKKHYDIAALKFTALIIFAILALAAANKYSKEAPNINEIIVEVNN